MRRLILGLTVGVVLTLGAVRMLGAGAPAEIPRPGDVMSGRDLGFLVEKVGSDRVVGTFVVRVNGEWTAAEQPSPPEVIPAKP
jgi:hypothetical protein